MYLVSVYPGVLADARHFCFLEMVQIDSWYQPALYSTDTGRPSPGSTAATNVKLTTYLHVVPNLRRRGAVPPFSPYAWFTLVYLMSLSTAQVTECWMTGRWRNNELEEKRNGICPKNLVTKIGLRVWIWAGALQETKQERDVGFHNTIAVTVYLAFHIANVNCWATSC